MCSGVGIFGTRATEGVQSLLAVFFDGRDRTALSDSAIVAI
jgi:hypothetical protein